MFRDDFISRQITILVQVLARMLKLTKGREFIDALALLEMSFREHLGTDLHTLTTVPDDRVMDFLTFGQMENQRLMRCGIAVALLQATGTLFREQGKNEQGMAYVQKGLNLLLEVELAGEEPPDLPEFVPTVDEMLEGLDVQQLTMESRGTLVFYFEQEGDYATAERVLNTMVADAPDDPETHALALSFYEYLLDETDETLAEGGLSRDHITATLAGLQTH